MSTCQEGLVQAWGLGAGNRPGTIQPVAFTRVPGLEQAHSVAGGQTTLVLNLVGFASCRIIPCTTTQQVNTQVQHNKTYQLISLARKAHDPLMCLSCLVVCHPTCHVWVVLPSCQHQTNENCRQKMHAPTHVSHKPVVTHRSATSCLLFLQPQSPHTLTSGT